ncbi:hypothetical protein THASP1DRAFT_18658, partial [Thamnocephalis sphaerospora]
ETGWNTHNQYSNLRAPVRAVLDFAIPHGLSIHVARSPASLLQSAHSFRPLPRMAGSIGYMYTSRPLPTDSERMMEFTEVAERFHGTRIFTTREGAEKTPDTAGLAREPEALLYGRMFLPTGELEALIARRTSAHSQYLVTGFSSPDVRQPLHVRCGGGDDGGGGSGALTLQWLHDRGPWCTEVSYSTDDAMLGVRGLYNFNWPKHQPAAAPTVRATHASPLGNVPSGDGVWSAGAELYYSAKEKSGGASAGLRYRATQPFAFEMVNIVNPVMGYMSTAYTAAVNQRLTCSTRFDFNLYSYESDLCVGAEWRNGGEGVVKGRFGFRQVGHCWSAAAAAAAAAAAPWTHRLMHDVFLVTHRV